MVNDIINLQSLNLEELSGVVTLYPWYAQARMELCRRMAQMGDEAWSDQRFAQEALYIGSRRLVWMLLHKSNQNPDYTDTPPSAAQEPQGSSKEPQKPRFLVVGGDFFSKEDYEQATEEGDNYFSGIKAGESVEVNLEGIEADEFTDFCTETLAQVYLNQGYTEKAKNIYSQLSLRYPEKSVYFAALIEKIGK